ncbi:MAG TPA: Spy/CpxP family protein refolding chaperone [Polyangiaceae bacterium]|nr:Spy/CpxP family protein refolding chaperone [Polyangiaceae bacterium]
MSARAFRLVGAAGLVATLALAASACESTPPAAPPPATPAAVAPAPVAPAPAGSPGVAPAAAASPGAQPASPAAAPEQGEAEEHRHHHGGVIALIAMSLKDLDLSADQKAAVEKVRAALVTKMEPARAAGQDLSNTLADGVAAGSVDRAKADAAIGKLVAQVQAAHGSSLDAMNQLHAVLTPAQRAALVDKLQEHFEKWKEANGHEDQEGQHRSGPMLGLVKDLSLSQSEAQQIKDSYRNLLKASAPAAGGQDHQHKDVADHLQAFGTAFKADKFNAHALAGASAAAGSMARWGATRMARFLEAAAPVLTPDQRTKLAQLIRDRAGQHAS